MTGEIRIQIPEGGFQSFKEFYPYYLQENENRVCRLLHFLGTLLALSILLAVLVTHQWEKIVLMPVFGYGFAWVGHYGFEKNRPATFK